MSSTHAVIFVGLRPRFESWRVFIGSRGSGGRTDEGGVVAVRSGQFMSGITPIGKCKDRLVCIFMYPDGPYISIESVFQSDPLACVDQSPSFFSFPLEIFFLSSVRHAIVGSRVGK